MPRHTPTLFSLVADGKGAENVLAHPLNRYLLSTVIFKGKEMECLDIGQFISKSGHNTLATIGRGETDVFVEFASISKLQCSFEIEASQPAPVVMLYDRSHSGTTQVSGDNAMPFENGRLRKVVVDKDLNTKIGMGGKNQDLVVFNIVWHIGKPNMHAARILHHHWTTEFRGNSRLARTVSEAETRVLAPRRPRCWSSYAMDEVSPPRDKMSHP
jgi:hypothetical protein